jgi:hypothetical protein
MSDPFAPPQADQGVAAAARDGVPPYVLFTPGHVAGATFLGSALAGTLLLALNAQRLGKPMGRPVASGVGLFVALMAAAFVLPEGVPNIVYTLAAFELDLLHHADVGGVFAFMAATGEL